MTANALKDAFRAFSDAEIETSADEVVSPATPIRPVPFGTPAATFRHQEFGEPTTTWDYRDGRGDVLGHVARFETPSGKVVLPRTWWRSSDGTERWQWKAFSEPRPLYGLDRLAERPSDVVLIVEGEKTVDAAVQHFPSHVVVTWPGGCNAVAKADWSVLKDRAVVLWPDADEAGRKAMNEVAKAACEAGAASVREVVLPAGLPTGWDLADPVPANVNLAEIIHSAKACRTGCLDLPAGYVLSDRGLIWRDPTDGDKPELLLAGPFQVLAETRDTDGNAWGILLAWPDHDGRPHQHSLPRASLAGDGADARKILLDGGLYVAPGRGARERLTAFLLSVRSSNRRTATNKIGWHGETFVLPGTSFGSSNSEEYVLQNVLPGEHHFGVRGTLPEWQDQIGRYASGNSRLVVSISAALAACLVTPCEQESGGLHFRGASSIGKSTALAVAGSVWGGGGTAGYVKSWRSTSNGLEGMALAHCDALLCLDELSQVQPRDAGEIAYMLANGSGKHRSARDGSARRAARWKLLFLSSGEISLADKVAEDGRGKRPTAGQQVRIIDVPADPGMGYGLFEHLHEFASAEAFASHLKSASSKVYGCAAQAFLRHVTSDLAAVREHVRAQMADFVKTRVPAGADGQVGRVAQRFALIAAAGELGARARILPWSEGEATAAAAQVFADWLGERGSLEPAEVRDGISQIRAFLLTHGMSRFIPAWEIGAESRPPLRDVAGFRMRNGEGWDYYVNTSAWANDLCAGFDRQLIAQQLADRGMLSVPTSGAHRAKSLSVPGYGRLRLYHVLAHFLEDRAD